MKITIQVADQRINDLIHGHQGRDSYWLHELRGNLFKDGKFTVEYDRANDAEGSNKGRKTITPRMVHKGLSLMAASRGHAWAQFMGENDDDVTFYIAMQYIIFGKEVYA